MKQHVLGIIDPTETISCQLKLRLKDSYQFIESCDFITAKKQFHRQTLLAVIIYWEVIENNDFSAIQQLRDQLHQVVFFLFAPPMKNELGLSLGRIGIDSFIEFGDWLSLVNRIELLVVDYDFKIDLSDFGINHSKCSFLLKGALEIMRKDFLRLKTVAEVANQLHISTGHLQNLFIREIDFSCKQLLSAFKAYYCVWQMEHSQLSLKEIGKNVGFEYPANFSRFFANVTGVSATAYRRNYCQQNFFVLLQQKAKKNDSKK